VELIRYACEPTLPRASQIDPWLTRAPASYVLLCLASRCILVQSHRHRIGSDHRARYLRRCSARAAEACAIFGYHRWRSIPEVIGTDGPHSDALVVGSLIAEPVTSLQHKTFLSGKLRKKCVSLCRRWLRAKKDRVTTPELSPNQPRSITRSFPILECPTSGCQGIGREFSSKIVRTNQSIDRQGAKTSAYLDWRSVNPRPAGYY
jgi:hypothetical protein